MRCIKKEMVKGIVRLFLVVSNLVIEVNPYFYNFNTLKVFIQFKRDYLKNPTISDYTDKRLDYAD